MKRLLAKEKKRLMSASFFDAYDDIIEHRHTHYWFKGGRGSTKSSFISIMIIKGIMEEARANAVVLRKVGVNIKDSVFAQLEWAIAALGVEDRWEVKRSPLELSHTRKDGTQGKILFRGADNPVKIKSIKFKEGYCSFVWFEEADEFRGMEEIRLINQSLLRGGEVFRVFYSYNPPKSQRSWINSEILNERDDRLIHHSDYTGVGDRGWLGEQFYIEAEHLREVNPDAYRNEYLGEATGTGGEVFTNLTIREIEDGEIEAFDRIARGIDWGYASDPFHYTVNHYDRTRRRLYIFYEIHKVKLSNRKAAELIRYENKGNGLIICDSAEPKSIAEMSGLGLKVAGAKKGPDSVDYGIKWLQDLEEIVIDQRRCPKTAEEFLNYEMESDGKGGYKAEFSGRNNHSIDAVRYSREGDMRSSRVV